jgi:hypothetical protein
LKTFIPAADGEVEFEFSVISEINTGDPNTKLYDVKPFKYQPDRDQADPTHLIGQLALIYDNPSDLEPVFNPGNKVKIKAKRLSNETRGGYSIEPSNTEIGTDSDGNPLYSLSLNSESE